MTAVVVRSHQGGAAALELKTVEVPRPPPGHVLVRVSRAPINPNDLLALKNQYEVPKPIGTVAGFEGSGKVVAGAGFMARMMIGRRVAFSAASGSGAWAEYAIAPAMQCAPVGASITDDAAATMLTNPLTSTVLIARALREGHRAVVQAAAAGALGKMLARLALTRRLPMIHVVRSEAQRQAVVALGAANADVFDSSAAGFDQALRDRARALGATLALDPVGGELTGRLLAALADGGIVRVYGALSGQPAAVDVNELVFRGKRIEGFTMYDWVKATSLPRQLLTLNQVQRQLAGPLATEVRSKVPLAGFAAALAEYERAMSGGKILFTPVEGA